MVTSNQALKEKESLQRMNIRTMKKDLQKLRETDALKEREKISNVKLPIVKSPSPNDIEDIRYHRDSFNEIEEAKELNHITKPNITQETQIPVPINEEIKILHDENNLAVNIDNENIPSSERTTPSKEMSSNNINTPTANQHQFERALSGYNENPSHAQDKRTLEEAKWKLEEQRQDIEKKRWSIEEELVTLEDKIKNLDEGYKKSPTAENILKAEITDIDNPLRADYPYVAGKEQITRKELGKESVHEMHLDASEKNTIKKWGGITSQENQEREYLKKIPSAAKEILVKSERIEEKQRRKFIEDVEKWAAEKKNLPNEQTGNNNTTTNE